MRARFMTHSSLRMAGLALACAVWLGSPAPARSASVSTDHYTYLPSENITVFFEGGPGNKLDWIGLYPDGIVPGSQVSTRWFYVDGTQGGSTGLMQGSVAFDGGLPLAGDYAAFLLLNDGYTVAAETKFRVIDPSSPFVRLSKAVYKPGEAISISFTNGPGNAKDWIGVYPEGRMPGNGNSLLWFYVDGTEVGSTGITEGTLMFNSGLAADGKYVAYLLINDGYDIAASEPFSVVTPPSGPRVTSISPLNDATNASPEIDFAAVIVNSATKVAPASVKLYINGAKVTHSYAIQTNLVTIGFTNQTVLPSLSTNAYRLEYSDDGVPPQSYTNEATFVILGYTNIVLPAPLFFENFDSTPEGSLPAGWRSESYTDALDPNFDLQDLNSASYANWVVVNRERFTSNFLSYTDHTLTDDYKRVLSFNPANVVDGRVVRSLATGRLAFGDSGYRSGTGQFIILYTPDIDLRGKTNVYLSFHSLWEQNQDSMAAIEYSTDQGVSWLPASYFLASSDVATNDTGAVDAVATFENPQTDVYTYSDPVTGELKGGYYGAYIGATNYAALAPFISPRIDDDAVGSKRVELLRLAQADNQPKVRLRFAHSGTDSWYFGIDDVGLYSLAQTPSQPASLSIRRSGSSVVVSWPASETGYTLEQTSSLKAPNWTAVGGVVNNSVTVPIESGPVYYRLLK